VARNPAPSTSAALGRQPLGDRVSLRGRSLREATARGTVVNALFTIALNSLALVKGFVVAAFLSASEYGVWGVLVISLGTLVWLKQVGFADKYVQQSDEDQQLAFQRAFTLELLVTGLFTAILLAAVPLVAFVYGREEVLAPGVVVALMLPAGALQAPTWVFYRRMEFARQRALQAIDPFVAFVVTVGLAAAGAGYWSLVVGVAAGAWAAAAAAVKASPYPLALRYDRGTLRQYADFSWPLFVAALCSIVIAQGTMVAGEAALGLARAGAIALAATIAQYAERVDGIVTGTLYPAVSAARDRLDLLLEVFVKSNRLALMWGMPFGVGVALFASDLVEFGLGERWRDAVFLIQAFGLIAAVSQIGFNWHAFYRARGDTRPMAVVSVTSMAVFLVAALPLLLTSGLDGLALGMGIVAAAALVARALFVLRLFPGFAIARHVARAIAPTVPAAGVVLLVRLVSDLERTPAVAIGELAAYLAITAALTLILERALLREVSGYLRAGPGPSSAAAA
jgi:O-antigen/teichoic acid export membrane protein